MWRLALPCLLALGLLAGLSGAQAAKLWAEGCADHELLRFVTCHTHEPIYIAIGSLNAFSRPLALMGEEEFLGCTGVALTNGTTVAVRGSMEDVKTYWQKKRSKYLLCRRLLGQKVREFDIEQPDE